MSGCLQHIEIIRIILMPNINSAILLVLQVCVKFSPVFIFFYVQIDYLYGIMLLYRFINILFGLFFFQE